MMKIDPLPLCFPTLTRMGYETAVAGISIMSRGILHEIALVAPGGSLGDQWSLVTHQDCDPQKPDQGVSGVNSFGSREDAENAFRQELVLTGGNRLYRRYCVRGLTKANKPAYASTGDGEGMSFQESADSATLFIMVAGADRFAQSMPKYGTYYGAENHKLKSFAVHEVAIQTKRVVLSMDHAMRLSEEDATAPDGWSFAMADASGERFATPQNHWATSGSIEKAALYKSLRAAIRQSASVAEPGNSLILIGREVNPQAMTPDQVASTAALEEQIRSFRVPPAKLSEDDIYRPFGP